MKKSLVALAVLASVAGFAQAQSTVTVYGVADLAINKISGGNTLTSNTTTLNSSSDYNQSGSRLGFRGTEDLGNGLKASFQLESGIHMDTGASAQSGLAFGRQAWAGLEGNFGGVKLGRQNSSIYKALVAIDPFEDGFAGAATANMFTTPTNGLSSTRVNNTVAYSTPAMSGFSGELQYSFGEDASVAEKGRVLGLGLAYANGPANARVAYFEYNNAETYIDKRTLIGGSWDFGVAKVHAGYQSSTVETIASGAKGTDRATWLIGAKAPVGPGTLLASYSRRDDKTSANIDRTQWAVGYNYGLSKRTSLYTSYASVKDSTKKASNVANVGVRHAF